MASKKAGSTPAAEAPRVVSVFSRVVAEVSPWLVSHVGEEKLRDEVTSIYGVAFEVKDKGRNIVEIKGTFEQISAVHDVLKKYIEKGRSDDMSDRSVTQKDNNSEKEDWFFVNGNKDSGKDAKDSTLLSDERPDERPDEREEVPESARNENSEMVGNAVEGLNERKYPSQPVATSSSSSAASRHSDETLQSDSMSVRPELLAFIRKKRGADMERIENSNRVIFIYEGKDSVCIKGNDNDLVRKAQDEFITMCQELNPVVTVKNVEVPDVNPQNVKKVVKDIQEQSPNVLLDLDDRNVNSVQVVGVKDEVESVVKRLRHELKLPLLRRGRPQKDTGESARLDKHEVPTSDDKQTFLKVETRLGTVIKVRCGDITKETVDAIVNAANSKLKHMGGVAKAIAKAGGPEIQAESRRLVKAQGEVPVTEVVVTTAGKLPCACVIHCVGPRWGKDVDCHKLLHETCTNVLEKAHRMKLKSIAVPAISTGIYGVPTHICATAMREAIQDFESRHVHGKRTELKEIRLIDCNQETVRTLAKEISHLSDELERGYLELETNVDTGESFQPTDDHDSSGGAAAAAIADTDEYTDSCTICLEACQDPESLPCSHTFCSGCLAEALKRKKQCPNCYAVVGEVQGDQPPGYMNCRVDKTTSLPGHSDCGSIIISYNIPSGIQQECHPEPGKRFSGTRRKAYLPDNQEGRKVRDLLRKAFDRRLIFTIGTSHTTGYANTVVWNDIHHKTNTHGGPDEYGYPDPTYLNRVREELAAKGII